MRLDEIQAGHGGILGAVARAGLGVLSLGWAAGSALQRATYAIGLRRAARLPVPVISVGNLAVGGTGKTPFTAWLARGLLARDRRPGILSRGYGPRAAPPNEDVSDEGAVLRALLGADVPMVEDPDRHRGGRRLLAEHPTTDVLLLDDGFQHRRLARDLDVVLLDATRPFGYGHLLPRGRLRETPKALKRAHAVVLTRTERVDGDALDGIRAAITRHATAPVLEARTVPAGVVVAGEPEKPGWLADRRVFAACGIGHPKAFLLLLEDLGARVEGHFVLSDHANLSAEAWASFVEAAAVEDVEYVITTRKDAVKLATPPPEVAVLDVELEITAGEADLWAAIDHL